MSNLNKFMGIGRLTRDPESKQVSTDFKVVNFSIAISEKWTDKQSGEKKESTEFINCQASNKVSEIVEKYVKKGDMLYVEGKFKTRNWEKDGVKQYTTYIQVEGVNLFPKAKTDTTDDTQALYKKPEYTEPIVDQQVSDDLPF
jgi:single-strand DNA-binding protein